MTKSESTTVASPSSSARAGARPIRATDLFAGRREVVIEHEGARYRLQLTRNGKLILTK